MAHTRRNRGSVLLLAIGLLTIIAILASTFLIVANLDAHQAETLAVKAQADPIAEGVLSTAQAWAGSDVYANSQGPFGRVPNNTTGWRMYADVPHQDNNFDNSVDPWLSCEYIYGGDRWTHVSNIVGERDDQGTTLNKVNNVPYTSADLVDTDGDAIRDAYRFYTGVVKQRTNMTDIKYYAAVRVVDLAGRVCVNTAAGRDADSDVNMPTTFAPIYTDLRTMIGVNAYGKVHERRRGTGLTALNIYETRCARKLLAPDNTSSQKYTPYAIGDEMFLLWSAPLGQKPATDTGTLAEDLGDIQDDHLDQLKRRLTTFSSTRAVVRHPDPANDYTGLRVLRVDTEDRREAAWRRAYKMLKELGIGNSDPVREKMAAHFVANLHIYQGGNPDDGFTPKGASSSFTVYGLKQDLVISEVYVTHKASDSLDPNTDNHYWGCAIELMNASREAVGLNSYSLEVSNYGTMSLSGKGALAASDGNSPVKFVLYNCGNGPDWNQGEAGIFGGTDPNAAGWVKLSGLDLRGSDLAVRLKRGAVPADEFTTGASGLDYTVENKQNPDPNSLTKDMRRDDRVSADDQKRARYNLACYKRFGGHMLGKNNGLSDNDLTNANDTTNGKTARYSCPIFHPGREVRSIGETANIYFVGPIVDGASSAGFPSRILLTDASSLFDDTFNRGRLAYHPDDARYGGYSPGAYPDVPAGCLFNEFFTHVPTHDRRKPGLDREHPENSRIYGLVNVNVATQEVLRRLPFPETVTRGGRAYSIDANEAAAYIIAYREDTGNSSSRSSNYNISNLRTSSGCRGFLTPGEVAIPLAQYMDKVMGADVKNCAEYVRARNSLYEAIADCITTRSDVFAAYIRVQLDDPARYVWYYIAILDRSNVVDSGDSPAILMFAEVK